MAIRSIEQGKRWLVEVDREGIPRKRKIFKNKIDAEAFENQYITSNLIKSPVSLFDIVKQWKSYHEKSMTPNKAKLIDTILHLTSFL